MSCFIIYSHRYRALCIFVTHEKTVPINYDYSQSSFDIEKDNKKFYVQFKTYMLYLMNLFYVLIRYICIINLR